MVELNESLIAQSMVEFEGFSIEEAKLTYATREKLPETAFCGPNRTYPAHDADHVRSGLQKLSQFGAGLKGGTKARILNCLKTRAKKMGIQIEESAEESIYNWYMNEIYPNEICKECATK
jgi:hypothetical protein